MIVRGVQDVYRPQRLARPTLRNNHRDFRFAVITRNETQKLFRIRMLSNEERGADGVAREVHLAEHKQKISATYCLCAGRRNHHVGAVIEGLFPTRRRRVEDGKHSRSQLLARILEVLPSVTRNGQHTRPTLLKQRWNLIDRARPMLIEQQRLRGQPEGYGVYGRGA